MTDSTINVTAKSLRGNHSTSQVTRVAMDTATVTGISGQWYTATDVTGLPTGMDFKDGNSTSSFGLSTEAYDFYQVSST